MKIVIYFWTISLINIKNNIHRVQFLKTYDCFITKKPQVLENIGKRLISSMSLKKSDAFEFHPLSQKPKGNENSADAIFSFIKK